MNNSLIFLHEIPREVVHVLFPSLRGLQNAYLVLFLLFHRNRKDIGVKCE